MLIASSTSYAKNVAQSKIFQLREIPAQDQIDYLLSQSRLEEAIDIFNLKVKKGGGDFSMRQNKFFLDLGWIRLTKKLDFFGMLKEFKSTDVDPRELILMFKNLLVSKPETLQKHFTRTQFNFDVSKIIEDFKLNNNRNEIRTEPKVGECKRVVAQILEHKNQKFISEIKLKPQETMKFLYSKYSPFSSFIKVERKGVLLREVLCFVQTNLIKLYAEQNDQQAIYTFFNSPHNRNQIFIDHEEIEDFLGRIFDEKIRNVTMALILEHTGKITKALDKWMQLQSEEGCKKTVSILRQSSITSQDTIFKYLKWVLVKMPEVGLSLFMDRLSPSSGLVSKDAAKEKASTSSAGGAAGKLSSSQMINQSVGGTSKTSEKSGGGALEELTHEQILEQLLSIERELNPIDQNDPNLLSKRPEKLKKMYPYRERYLEYVVEQGENQEQY
mmetsp:Transcript_16316/g.27575  ORF Transcript_16316/g.27575 Transcript_16316/m.27575 type:complete len:442 (-) Transcript_16316:888-2213(-)